MIILIGLIIGLVLGLTGAGGSVFAVPLLVLLLGLTSNEAMALALAAVAASSIYGSILQRNSILWRPALLLSAGGLLSAPLGKYLAGLMPDLWLFSGFTLLAASISLRMWMSAIKKPKDTLNVRATTHSFDEESNQAIACKLSPNGQFQLKPRCLSGLIGGGLFIGLLSGLFGVGGGFLIIPFLLYLSEISFSRAVASSLLAIAVISSSGFLSHSVLYGFEHVNLLLPLLIASFAGMFASQLLAARLAGPSLQKFFAVSLLLLSAFTLIKLF